MRVRIRELSMREGVQICRKSIPTEVKVSILEKLGKLEFDRIEATSIVRPDLVPQHADFEAVLQFVSKLESRKKFTALYLNPKGFNILSNYDLGFEPWIQTAISEEFLIKNVSRTTDKEKHYFDEIQQAFANHGFDHVKLMVSCAFGYSNRSTEDEFAKTLESKLKLLNLPLSEICLADTMGLALPNQVKQFVRRSQSLCSTVSLHLHDTLGLGILNVMAGLETGVNIFESSLGGVGGCPFVEGASGNVATEEIILALTDAGVDTGVNLSDLVDILKLYLNVFDGYIHSKAAKAVEFISL